ncbi:plantaricin C family lantibiotic [Clostridium oceanicum]|uniref:Plantaricin C family lantibiotic n=1 Tax=Clostridium oceanicum TaxID=1543 RepID=A0ABP3V7N6_9CLOT
MGSVNMLKNPVLKNKFSNNEKNPAGDLLLEVSEQDFSLNISGAEAYNSEGLGNSGSKCSWSRECQRICNWISYGSGGIFGC